MIMIALLPMASISTIVLQIQQVNAVSDADAAAAAPQSTTKNEISTMILDKYKQRVFKHLLNNKTITDNISNSTTLPVSIVVGVISPNGTSSFRIW